ncbi:MAG: adenylyltransferase/cytidyltransferase family protein [Candidatus Poseidoniales archaeon]
MKYVLVTGGFDPIHSGHLSYFRAAAKLGDKLIVGLNSDDWLERKKGRPFMPFDERAEIIENLKMVDEVIYFDDSVDHNGASSAIFKLRATVIGDKDELIVANGGDRVDGKVPEQVSWDGTPGIKFVFGVGGDDKKNSSRWILDEWQRPKVERPWGYYRVLRSDSPNVKLKELVVNPGKSLSMQRHEKRSEEWFVADGEATVYTIAANTDVEVLATLKQFNRLHIQPKQWHMLSNESGKPVKITEIQWGEECVESDIERHDHYEYE